MTIWWNCSHAHQWVVTASSFLTARDDVINTGSSRSLLGRGLCGLCLGAEMGRNTLHPRTSRSVAFAVSLETIIALPLAGGLSHIQVETQASSCSSEKGRQSRNGGERLQMALKSAGLKVLITMD